MLCPSRSLRRRAWQDRVSQHNTRPARQTKTAVYKTKTKTNFWSETGLVLRLTVSDHITGAVSKTRQWNQQFLTLKQFRRCIRRTAAERLQLWALVKLVAESKVGNFYVEIGVQQQVLRLKVHLFPFFALCAAERTCGPICDFGLTCCMSFHWKTHGDHWRKTFLEAGCPFRCQTNGTIALNGKQALNCRTIWHSSNPFVQTYSYRDVSTNKWRPISLLLCTEWRHLHSVKSDASFIYYPHQQQLTEMITTTVNDIHQLSSTHSGSLQQVSATIATGTTGMLPYYYSYCYKLPSVPGLRVCEWVWFNVPINTLQVISQTSLSSQSLALVLTTYKEQPSDGTNE